MGTGEGGGAPDAVVYAVDELDRIAWTNEAWDRFALANDSPHVRASEIVGTVLWRHVSDDTLSTLLRKLFSRARSLRRPLSLTCRCDGIHVRRDLRLELHAPEGKTVQVRSIVTSEGRRYLPFATGEPSALLRVCSWCNRVDVASQWVELEAAAEELRLLHGPYYPAMTHTICSPCVEVLEAEIAQP